MRVSLLFALIFALLTPTARAMTGSDAFICDVIRYSTNPAEVIEAEEEATTRGICGFASPPPVEAKKKKRHSLINPSEKAENAVFIGALIWAVSSGKIDGTITGQSTSLSGRPSPR